MECGWNNFHFHLHIIVFFFFHLSLFLSPYLIYAEKIIDILLSATKSYGLGEELDR